MRDRAFRNACALEQSGEIQDAIHNYQMILSNAKDARAALNLGTIYYIRRDFQHALELYRLATEISPDYALAHYNLGNVLDELLLFVGAVNAYQAALRLDPHHADSHYNLALLLETKGEHRRALKHWRAYIKIDCSGPHADHARRAIRKTIEADALMIVCRSS